MNSSLLSSCSYYSLLLEQALGVLDCSLFDTRTIGSTTGRSLDFTFDLELLHSSMDLENLFTLIMLVLCD